MKRILAFSLALLLFLSLCACGGKPSPEGTTAPEETTAAPTPAPSPVFSLPSLPEIGDFVPDTAPVKSFFPDGPADAFVPRDDYGLIVPYIADATYLRSPRYSIYTNDEGEEETYEQLRIEQWEAVFGLATADGRVVTKGLFSSTEYYDAPTGEGLYVLRSDPGAYGSGEGGYRFVPTTIIDSRGRWALELQDASRIETLFLYGMPVFFVVDGTRNTAVFYDLEGSAVADLSRFVNTRYHYPDFPSVVWADENGLLLRGVYVEGEEDRFGMLTRVDWDGNILFGPGKAPEDGGEDRAKPDAQVNWVDYHGGNALIGRTDGNGFVLLDLNGKRLTEEEYVYINYSKALDGFIGRLKISASRSEVRYFDASGRRIERENAWTNDSVYALHEDHAVTDKNGAARYCLDATVHFAVYDLFGNKVPLPAESKTIQAMCRLEDGTDGGFLFIHTKDGESFLCAEDGTLLAKTVSPIVKKYPYERSYHVTVSAQGGHVFVVTPEGDLAVYNGRGEETARIAGFYPAPKEDEEFYNLNVNAYGKNYVGAYQNPGGFGFYGQDFRLTVLSPEPRDLGVFSYIQANPDGGIAAISKTQSYLFGPEGEELMRFTLPDFY